MNLKVLSYPDAEQVRIWRNENLSMNRTPFLLTEQQQAQFYHNVICDRNSNFRAWGIWADSTKNIGYGDFVSGNFIGMGEISNIIWENRLGEIGLIMHPEHPEYSDKANEAVELILEQGFDYLNLENIFGECYGCSPYISFWEKIARKYKARDCYLPARKYWDGKYYDSLYFNISREDWKKIV
jgi:RimJ/RimL family protein N-acetyltransferase